MSLATTKGKEHALFQLSVRRHNPPVLVNEPGIPWFCQKHYACIACGADIEAPGGMQNLITFPEMPRLCVECQAMKDLGWLE